ncbi:MAG: 2Fe-2S iron-sulfur cluster-binding protein, partial [Acidimicrobiales bacterium]
LDSGEPVRTDDITELLSGHICRCTGYATIIDALKEVLT